VNVELQVIGSALRAVAEEMGAVLIRSAFSANIKERRDCSTALFDEAGRMIAQAEHIPVHLGAMPDAVAAVMARDPAPGEVWALNDPYAGGTHLPDITLVSRTEVGFAVSRAHHADVGGREPGSMPADSSTLAEEGVVIPPTRLTAEVLEELVGRMRNPDERRGDLRAQLAANQRAERRIRELCAKRSRAQVVRAMDELFAYSERAMRAGIARLPDGTYEASDVLEPVRGELELRAAVTVAGETVAIDFTGTSPQHDGNLNCPLAVSRSATTGSRTTRRSAAVRVRVPRRTARAACTSRCPTRSRPLSKRSSSSTRSGWSGTGCGSAPVVRVGVGAATASCGSCASSRSAACRSSASAAPT